jgi:hypothetical protein
MVERKVEGVKLPPPLKVENRPNLGVHRGMRHTVERLSRRATIFLETSSQLEVGSRSYEHPKS